MNCFASSGSLLPTSSSAAPQIAVKRIQRPAQFINVHRLRVRRAELQRRQFLLDLPGSAPVFRCWFGSRKSSNKLGRRFNVGHRRQFLDLFLQRNGLVQVESATTAPYSRDLSAESISFCSNTTDGNPGLCILMQVVIEIDLAGLRPAPASAQASGDRHHRAPAVAARGFRCARGFRPRWSGGQ